MLYACHRFDVSKSLSGNAAARNFWITHFGAENHSVDTARFIETLLFASADTGAVEYKEEHRRVVYRTIEQIVDNNRDGSVSPHEFHSFLKYFGPLKSCVAKVVGSLVDLKSSPPQVYSWFSWRAMDRADVRKSMPLVPGTFILRYVQHHTQHKKNQFDSALRYLSFPFYHFMPSLHNCSSSLWSFLCNHHTTKTTTKDSVHMLC